jgi:release factor glutamine methyltransferase
VRVPDELRAAAARLASAGVANPRSDAETLLAHLLGCGRGQLLLRDELTGEQRARLAGLVRRRAAGEPLQYLTGTAGFRYLELSVGPGVFIPRPETELIIELARDQLTGAATVVDLGAGSGAIALSVAHEFGTARVLAVERSAAALSWLRRNAEARAAAGDRPIEIVQADFGELANGDPAGSELAGRVDVVLANPPYVPERIRSELPIEIGHDPAEAVFAGPDGLSLMPRLAGAAARLLRAGGLLVIEHDESQRDSMARLLSACGDWVIVTGHADLTGRPRFSSAVRAQP